jgi:hypothetical protein
MAVRIWRVISADRYDYLVNQARSDHEKEDNPEEQPQEYSPQINIDQSGTGRTIAAADPLDHIEYMPKRLQRKARALLTILLQSPAFRVAADGSVIIDGNRVPESHISDLLSIAVQPGYLKTYTYPGEVEFVKLLRVAHVPRNLLSSRFLDRLQHSTAFPTTSKWTRRQLKK